ncbi:MAG: VanZ family protein [Thermus sp.]|uniref:VanZ family protein n=1 Tax=unclassified Thermus TaxID=2619321 RepID=UPI0002389D85|nr:MULTISPECIES: VanZ family protein [unclassified Thermus]AEV15469.1 VanZ [Thermus sp. CCB_US3_UF1]MCS6868254.1 VanZ family protein [Thermus sp.]MCS7218665.1 VanZ family protein [Thermus sp.]MCX7848589.1 VanZ family protein [Thermus sp.]MDW8017908.1 VanZ family protein [Thermus sp.]
MRRPWALVLALLHMGLLFWLSHQPATGAGLPHPWDKAAHFLAYLLLGGLLGLGLGRWRAAFLGAFLYGVGDEWHQSFIPGREAFGWDLVADALGAWVGARWGGRWEAPEASLP